MGHVMKCLIGIQVFFMLSISKVLAQTPEEAANSFSTRSIEILKGPIVKVLGVVIVLVGVSSLLRGRHKLALSCAVAFIVLLFMPFFLEQLGAPG